MARHLLPASTVKNAKAKSAPYRLCDGDGLFLLISPTGAKSWQYRYVLDGKQQTATLGKYPDHSLEAARVRAAQARRQAKDGVHITAARRIERARKAADRDSTFEALADRWIAAAARRSQWTESYVREVRASIDNHLSTLKPIPVAALRAAMCAPVLAKIEAAAPDMERKVRQRLRGILDFAMEEGVIDANPIPANRRRARVERKHFAAILDPTGVGAVLRAAAAADVSRGVRRAHLLATFTAQRIGEIVPAEWSEIDLDAGLWAIPRSRMKRKDEARGDHLVPIPPGLLASMREWHRDDGDDARYLCPAPRPGEHVTREAIEKFYRRSLGLAGRHSPHSWRSVLSTWANEAGKGRDLVEAQLDHIVGDAVQASYDRATRVDRRRELMTWHESRLLAARDGAVVVALHPTAATA